MRSHPLVLVALALPALLAACGDLQVRSVRSDDVVPAALAGEWVGTWTSSETLSTGAVTVRVQEFDRQPVVALSIDNPCVIPQDYELLFVGRTIELRADGVPILDAVLQTDSRELTGNYNCAADRGTWSASWTRELPELVDLSGTWSGDVSVPGVLTEPLTLTLRQSVRGGGLVLDGEVRLPSALALPVPVAGAVRFRDADFELVLQTEIGFQPRVVMTGIGDREPLQVEFGLLRVLSSQVLPFSQALFQITRDPAPTSE